MLSMIFFAFWILSTLLGHAGLAALLPDGNARQNGETERSFKIGKNCFLKDGEPFRYISGSFHYWRQPPEYWEDTFLKMRAAGLNTVQTYLIWNLHEPEPLQYNFGGDVDVRRFIKTAQKCGLLVVLRPGPFIDAEVDMGGLPYWLLRVNSTMRLRTSDQSYLTHVERWFRKVLPLFQDLTYANGGPIISAQVENEYGSFGNDLAYKEFLRDLTRELLGPDIILFTTDGDSDGLVERGRVNGTMTTVDFGAGANVTQSFLDVERKYNLDGPLVNSEFYPGWLDHWGEPFNTVDYGNVVKTMREMLDCNASVNVYMFYGGSNFGFVAGANLGASLEPIIQSYDYDAPLTEAGDPTEKYMEIRKLLQNYVPRPLDPVPPPRSKASYGKVEMHYTGSLFQNLNDLSTVSTKSILPLSFELLRQAHGFVLYRTRIPFTTRGPSRLNIDGLYDRTIVFLDYKPLGILSRSAQIFAMDIAADAGQRLDLLVQSEGRICYGSHINELKGILGNVSIDGRNLTEWEMFPIDLPGFPVKRPAPFRFAKRAIESAVDVQVPSVYFGELTVKDAQDTFLRMDGWRHGYAFVNGRNLGRYWPVQGPQKTLHVPGVFLNGDAVNFIELLELESAPCHHGEQSCFITSTDQPQLNGTVPQIGSHRPHHRESQM